MTFLEYSVGGAYNMAVEKALKAVPELVSLALDFVPIVGQLKGIIEAISGRDLITGRHLADWERGLNALLSDSALGAGSVQNGKGRADCARQSDDQERPCRR